MKTIIAKFSTLAILGSIILVFTQCQKDEFFHMDIDQPNYESPENAVAQPLGMSYVADLIPTSPTVRCKNGFSSFDSDEERRFHLAISAFCVENVIKVELVHSDGLINAASQVVWVGEIYNGPIAASEEQFSYYGVIDPYTLGGMYTASPWIFFDHLYNGNLGIRIISAESPGGVLAGTLVATTL